MNMDHISNLPDCVLSNILSRLSLKYAMQTSVLSTDWQFKWTSVYNVDINIEDIPLESENELKFFTNVEMVLRRLQNIKNFRFMCSTPVKHELFGMTVLVSAMLRHNVKRLELDICNTQDFFLPCSLWYFTSIRHLSVVFETPTSFRFPARNTYRCLKCLTLERVKIVNDTPNTDTLVFILPVLKSLQLIECEWVNVKFVEINAPALYTFKSVILSEWDDNKEFDYTIKIIGAGLNELETGGSYPENISVIGAQVACADLLYVCDNPLISLEEYGLQIQKLLRELPNLEYLNIEEIQAIGRTKLGLSLPRFRKLKILRLGSPFDAEGMLQLLHAAPFLEHLVLFLDLNEDETENDYEYDSVGPLPNCIVNRLEKVMLFYDYDCESPKSKFHVEKFLMKNGAQLKSMFIMGRDEESEKEIIEKLSKFPKASACLEIVSRFTGYRQNTRNPSNRRIDGLSKWPRIERDISEANIEFNHQAANHENGDIKKGSHQGRMNNTIKVSSV